MANDLFFNENNTFDSLAEDIIASWLILFTDVPYFGSSLTVMSGFSKFKSTSYGVTNFADIRKSE